MRISVSILVFLATLSTLVTANKRCPDRSSCSDEESTCCKIRSGEYDCCPLSNAVCCPSGLYCCPSGTSCNEKDGTCDQGLQFTGHRFTPPSNISSFPEQLGTATGNKCLDQEHECSDKETCCKLQKGGFGCCPYPGAVCCSDGQHCCPHGSKCDLKEQKCSRKQMKQLSMRGDGFSGLANRMNREEEEGQEEEGGKSGREDVQKFNQETGNVKNVLSAVICPGKEVQCPDESTCCKLKDGQQGCCPLPKANCCPDQVHCCPDGFTCLETGCKRNGRGSFVNPFGI